MNVVAKMRQAGFIPALSPAGGLLIEPASKLTPEQRDFIRAHKVLLLEELRGEAANDAPLVTAEFDQEAFEERAAILEFDAGFSREEAERRAQELMALGWAPWNARARAESEALPAWKEKMEAMS